MFVAIPTQLGYGALFGLVAGESAGVPLPGETALVAASLLAAAGHLSFPVVVAVAATAAILGDNLGYWIGRRGGRTVLQRDGRFSHHRRKLLAQGEQFFERHGPKTVFIGRWVTGVRVVAAVVAGASHMPWGTFLIYNAAGAITWAASIAAVAAIAGPTGAAIIYGVGLAAAGVAALWAASSAWRARRRPAPVAAPAGAE